MPCEIKPNGPTRRAIDAFLERQRNVYRADPTRIERDAKSAEHATKDHVGRWFYEVFQNCDDACQNMGSGEVEVRVTPGAGRIADVDALPQEQLAHFGQADASVEQLSDRLAMRLAQLPAIPARTTRDCHPQCFEDQPQPLGLPK